MREEYQCKIYIMVNPSTDAGKYDAGMDDAGKYIVHSKLAELVGAEFVVPGTDEGEYITHSKLAELVGEKPVISKILFQ